MTERTQLHHRHNLPSARLAALDFSSDDIVRPEFCNDCIPAGKRIPRRDSPARDQRRAN